MEKLIRLRDEMKYWRGGRSVEQIESWAERLTRIINEMKDTD